MRREGCTCWWQDFPRRGALAPGIGQGSASDEEGEPDWKTAPCKECGRRYPHQHVRALRPGRYDDAGSGDEL